ncbi:hypothetical protein ACP3VW_17710 [Vibrio sp. DNB22_17_1]
MSKDPDTKREPTPANGRHLLDDDQYDITVIAQIDTLMGVDCLELAYRATLPPEKQGSLDTTVKSKALKIQLLGVEGGWNASLDSSTFFEVNKPWLERLSKEKKQGLATYRNWTELNTGQYVGVGSCIVIYCLQPGKLTSELLKTSGVVLHQMGTENTPLEELAEWLGVGLLPIDQAHSIYHRDYLPGLSAQGIPLKTQEQKLEGANKALSLPSVDKIVLRTQQFSRFPIESYSQAPEVDKFRVDDFWCGISKNTAKQKSREEKESIKSDRDVCLYLVDEHDLTEQDYRFPQYLTHFLDAINYQHCLAKRDDSDKYSCCSKKHQPIDLPTSLVLFCRQREEQPEPFKRVEVIEFVTSKRDGEALRALASDHRLNGLAKVSVFSGQYSHYFCARINEQYGADRRTIVDYIIDNLLGISLHGDRPLVTYGSTFFLPFRQPHTNRGEALSPTVSPFNYRNIIVASDEDVRAHQNRKSERFNLIANERDTFLYMDPVIRERLFQLEDGELQRIEEWRADISPDDELTRSNSKHIWSVVKTAPNGTSQWNSATVRNIKLYKFYNDVYILAVNVYEQFFDSQSSFTRQDNDWWHDLFTNNEQVLSVIERAMVKHWLTYTDKIRQLYPSFAERERDKQSGSLTYFFGEESTISLRNANMATGRYTTPRKLNFEELNSHHYHLPSDIMTIFETLGVQKVHHLKPFIDNRMFINTAYGLAGNCMVNSKSKEKYEALFSLAAYADDINAGFSSLKGYAYDPEFIRDLLDGQSYGRWRALGNLYAFTDYSNVYMGFGNEFNENIVPRHVFYNYQNMLLMGLFYRESLHDFSERVSEVSKRIDVVSQHEFQTIRKDFIRFTNVSWFQELTSQIQGKEVYQKQLSGLNIKKEYEFLEKEISATYQHFQAVTAQSFTRLTFAFACATLLGTAYKLYGDQSDSSPTLWEVPLLFLVIVLAMISQKKVVNSLVIWGQASARAECGERTRSFAWVKEGIRSGVAKLGAYFRAKPIRYWGVVGVCCIGLVLAAYSRYQD